TVRPRGVPEILFGVERFDGRGGRSRTPSPRDRRSGLLQGARRSARRNRAGGRTKGPWNLTRWFFTPTSGGGKRFGKRRPASCVCSRRSRIGTPSERSWLTSRLTRALRS